LTSIAARQMIVITALGLGKSSLAFDTLYAKPTPQ